MNRTLLLLVVLLASACSSSDEPGTIESDGPTTAVAAETPATGVTSPTTSAGDGSAISDETVGPARSELIWTVIGVEQDDTLNVRSEPDPPAEVVTRLAAWETAIEVTEDLERNETGTWLAVRVGDEPGWVNGRFLVGQPAALTDGDRAEMVAATNELTAWVLEGQAGADLWLSERALWIGGVGIYADYATPWIWTPAAELQTSQDWRTVRYYGFGVDDSGQEIECAECNVSPLDFLLLERSDETTRTLIDDIATDNFRGISEGQLFSGPNTLHRSVLDTPSTMFLADDGTLQPSLDWRRIHFVFDWSSGEPEVALIHTHGWQP